MRTRTRILLGAGTAALLTLGSLAGLARADMPGGPGPGPGCSMGGFHRLVPRGMMGQQLMERYDTNKDGVVTQAEIDQNRQQWLAEFDTDKDGMLSLEEFKMLWLKAHNEMMVRDFQFLDRDGNGRVTLEEYKEPTANIVADLDRNGDGSIGRDDRPGPGEGPGWRHGGMMRPAMMGEGHGPCMGGGDGPDKPADEPGEAPASP